MGCGGGATGGQVQRPCAGALCHPLVLRRPRTGLCGVRQRGRRGACVGPSIAASAARAPGPRRRCQRRGVESQGCVHAALPLPLDRAADDSMLASGGDDGLVRLWGPERVAVLESFV